MKKKKKKKKGLFGVNIGSGGELNNFLKNMKFSTVFEAEINSNRRNEDGFDVAGGAQNLYRDEDSPEDENSSMSTQRTNSTNTEMRQDMASFMKKHIDRQTTEDVDEDDGGQGHVLKMASDLPTQSMLNQEPETPLMGTSFKGFIEEDPKTPSYKRQVFASVDSRDHSQDQTPTEVKKMGIDYSLFESKKGKKKKVEIDEGELKKLKKGKKGGLLKGLFSFGKKKKAKNVRRGSVSPKTPKGPVSPTTFGEKKPQQETIKQLKMFSKRLEGLAKQTEGRVNELKKKKTQFQANMLDVLESLKKRYLTDVAVAFRSYMTCKILLTDYRVKLEETLLILIRRKIKFSKQAVVATTMPSYVTEDFFRDTYHTLMGSEAGSKIWNKVKTLELAEKETFAKYDRMRRSHSKAKIGKEGEIFLRRFVLKDFEFPYNNKTDFEIVWQDVCEEKFNSIVGDKRTQTGMSISSFLEELSDIGMARVRPKEYIRYINSVVKCMKNIYNVTSKSEFKKMRSLVHRFIFGLIGQELINIEEEKNAELDLGYNENCVLLRHFSPIQLGVPRQFINPDGMSLSFQKSIEMLRNIQWCNDPNAMLHAIKLSCSSIGEEARTMCIKNGESWCFGADDFFPILTYVIVQCQVNDIHSHLKYISKFATLYTHEEGNSEVRYFLTCLDGAAEYVSGMTVEKLRDLLKEKNEKLKLKNFDPYEVNDVEFQRMEDCLIDCIDICEGMIEECQENKILGEEEEEEEDVDVDELLRNVGESDISEHLEIDDMDIDSFLLDKNGSPSATSTPTLTPSTSSTSLEENDTNKKSTAHINELLKPHMSEDQIKIISSIME